MVDYKGARAAIQMGADQAMHQSRADAIGRKSQTLRRAVRRLQNVETGVEQVRRDFADAGIAGDDGVPPGLARNVEAKPFIGQMDLQWEFPPGYDAVRSSLIRVTPREPDGAVRIVRGKFESAVVLNLQGGKPHDFEVMLVDRYGRESLWTAPVRATPMLTAAETIDLGELEMLDRIRGLLPNRNLATIEDVAKLGTEIITAPKLAPEAVTGVKVAPGAITGVKLADGTVTGPKLADAAVEGVKLADGAVSGVKLSARAVTAPKLAEGAVTGPGVAAGAITETKIADDSVTTLKVAAEAVTAARIATDAVIARTIQAGAVTTGALAAAAVTTPKLEAGAVTADIVAANAITTLKLDASAVTSEKIAVNAITAREVVAGAIRAGHIASRAVTTVKIDAGAVTAGEIASNAVTTVKLDAGAVVASKVAANAITAVQLDASAVNTTHLASDAITTRTIAANAVTAGVMAAQDAVAFNLWAGNAMIRSAAIEGLLADKIDAGTIRSGLIDIAGAGRIQAGRISFDSGGITFPNLGVMFQDSRLNRDFKINTGNDQQSLYFGNTSNYWLSILQADATTNKAGQSLLIGAQEYSNLLHMGNAGVRAISYDGGSNTTSLVNTHAARFIGEHRDAVNWIGGGWMSFDQPTFWRVESQNRVIVRAGIEMNVETQTLFENQEFPVRFTRPGAYLMLRKPDNRGWVGIRAKNDNTLYIAGFA